MLDDLRAKLAGSTVKPLYATETQAVALVGPALVLIARRPPDEHAMQATPRCVSQLVATYPQRGALVVVVPSDCPVPGDEARRYMHRMYTAFAEGVTAGAMVIEGTGFVAASKRSVVSLLLIKSRYPYPLKVFATTAEGAAFVCPRLPPEHAADAARIVAGIEELRAAYDGAFASAARKHA